MEIAMRMLVISDLHANLEALTAVLNETRRKHIDRVICLGDFVGYGAKPNQVLDRMRQMRAEKLYVRGNHDRVVAGEEDGEGFNQAARAAALWTRDQLSATNRAFVKSLPVGPVSDGNGILICHGSPFDEDEYIFSEHDAYRVLLSYEVPLIFFGHTHLPVVFEYDPGKRLSARLIKKPAIVTLNPARRYLINPGSVGQPRDRNPLASYLIFDQERRTVQYRRVRYDVSTTQQAIRRAGLPTILADRLAVGS
jgi:putative phosphoesterase